MKTTNDLNQKYSNATIAIHLIITNLFLILFPIGKYMFSIESEENLVWIYSAYLK